MVLHSHRAPFINFLTQKMEFALLQNKILVIRLKLRHGELEKWLKKIEQLDSLT